MVIRRGVRGKLQQNSRLSLSQPLEGEQLAAPTGCRKATSDKAAVSTCLVQLELTDVRLSAKREDEKEQIL